MIIGDWFDQTTTPVDAPTPISWRLVILAVVAYQAFVCAALLLTAQPGLGRADPVIRAPGGALLVLFLVVAAGAALTACPRHPVITCGALAGLCVAAASQGLHDYVIFPFLFSVYWVVSRSCLRITVMTTLAAVPIMVVTSVLCAPGAAVEEVVAQWTTLAFALVVAMATRAIRGWRRATTLATAEHERLATTTRELDEARARSRIAGELHDSVGHDLTAIIALSEGLVGLTGDPEIDEAMAGINQLARQGLAETRRAVASLGTPLLDGTHVSHGWDEIAPLTQTVRSLGTPVTFVETGPRPSEPKAADLAFTIAREALTNAVRHSPGGLTRVALTLDHEPAASILTIRSQGRSPLATSASHTGTGIARLRQELADAHGALVAGPDQDAWVVRATIPGPGKP